QCATVRPQGSRSSMGSSNGATSATITSPMQLGQTFAGGSARPPTPGHPTGAQSSSPAKRRRGGSPSQEAPRRPPICKDKRPFRRYREFFSEPMSISAFANRLSLGPDPEAPMKFLCLICADTHMERMSEADARKHFADYAEFTTAIRGSGHYVGCNRL